jgi:hypothetical protein
MCFAAFPTKKFMYCSSTKTVTEMYYLDMLISLLMPQLHADSHDFIFQHESAVTSDDGHVMKFLHPNVTVVKQPMDQEVIASKK